VIVKLPKSKHIMGNPDTCTIKQLQKYEVIAIDFIKSKKNLVDPLTRGLSRRQVLETARGIGLKPMN